MNFWYPLVACAYFFSRSCSETEVSEQLYYFLPVFFTTALSVSKPTTDIALFGIRFYEQEGKETINSPSPAAGSNIF
jgi:hypothetical protein